MFGFLMKVMMALFVGFVLMLFSIGVIRIESSNSTLHAVSGWSGWLCELFPPEGDIGQSINKTAYWFGSSHYKAVDSDPDSTDDSSEAIVDQESLSLKNED